MGRGVDFEGSNRRYGPPPGVSEEECRTLNVFSNGACLVSCWELTAEELAEVNRTGKVFLSVWSGQALFPVFVGSERTTHELVAEYGETWPLASTDRAQATPIAAPASFAERAAEQIAGLEAQADAQRQERFND